MIRGGGIHLGQCQKDALLTAVFEGRPVVIVDADVVHQILSVETAPQITGGRQAAECPPHHAVFLDENTRFDLGIR